MLAKDLLVSKMTLSLEANSVATVVHQVLKLSVEEMTLPELFEMSISRLEDTEERMRFHTIGHSCGGQGRRRHRLR